MTTLPTRPIPLRFSTRAHEHAWLTDSRHATSEGVVIYVHCAGCDAKRVDLQTGPQLPPVALSQSIRRSGPRSG